ncbi:MAG: LON peptidase substrate-binding domain-containing protein [Nitrospirae bacterium]|nr:LON peptidase substrate-binding domain-containing protein [Nitrospirota bacterium]
MDAAPRHLPTTVPVFPLPNVVLFPHTRMPLHIFEPRYLEMINNSLSGSRHIAMALLKPGWEPQYRGARTAGRTRSAEEGSEGGDPPEFCSIGCLGRIVAWEEQAEDRYNIVLLGVQKVEFGSTTHDRSYQEAPIRVLLDHLPESPDFALRLRRTLTETARTLLSLQGQPQEQVDQMMSTTESMPMEVVTNWACFLLNIEPATKQSLLELDDVALRCEQVTRIMVSRIESMSKSSPSSPPTTSPSSLN